MGRERRGFTIGRLIGTLALAAVLIFVIFLQIVLFVSGPAIHYDTKIAAQEKMILDEYKDIKQLYRHVFAYVIYSGQDDTTYYWFNEQGDLLMSRALDTLDYEGARKKVVKEYAMQDETVRLGYGYERAVYMIEDAQMEIYLDIDTLEPVFIRRKGL